MVGDPLLALGYFVGTLAPAVLECHGNFRGFAFFFFLSRHNFLKLAFVFREREIWNTSSICLSSYYTISVSIRPFKKINRPSRTKEENGVMSMFGSGIFVIGRIYAQGLSVNSEVTNHVAEIDNVENMIECVSRDHARPCEMWKMMSSGAMI